MENSIVPKLANDCLANDNFFAFNIFKEQIPNKSILTKK